MGRMLQGSGMNADRAVPTARESVGRRRKDIPVALSRWKDSKMIRRFVVGACLLTLTVALPACNGIGQASAPRQVPAGNVDTSNVAADQSATAASGGSAAQDNRTGRGPAVAGTIQSVNGTSVIVKNPRGGDPITVELTSGTTIQKQVTATLSD